MSNSARHRPRLVSGSFALVLGSELGMLTSFFLLVSVTPMAAAADGSGSAGAGLATGVLLLGTVVAELASPVLMRRCGYRAMLAAGALLMGASSLVMLAHGALMITIIASLVRGFGFGLGTVVLGALAALLVPADRRGEGLGLFDVVDTIPGVVALPAGVWLAGHAGFGLVVSLAAATALVAYDAGFGAGPAAFGVFVGVTGYPVGFALSAVMMVVALPLTRKPRPGPAAPEPDPAAVVAAVCGR